VFNISSFPSLFPFLSLSLGTLQIQQQLWQLEPTTHTIAKSWSFRLPDHHNPFTKVGLLTPSQVIVIVTLVVVAV